LSRAARSRPRRWPTDPGALSRGSSNAAAKAIRSCCDPARNCRRNLAKPNPILTKELPTAVPFVLRTWGWPKAARGPAHHQRPTIPKAYRP
jgi:hypothetical protein